MAWGDISRAAAIAAVIAGAALAVSKADIFGLESASSERADDVAQRLGIVAYGPADAGSARPGQDRVRVIYIDDEGLEALKPEWGGWPPGYENLAIMIEDVARAPGIPPARAVFVDLEITGENLTANTEAEFAGLVASLGALTKSVTPDAPGWAAVPTCYSDALTTLACMVEWGGIPIILAAGEMLERPTVGGTAPRDRLAGVAVLSPTLINARNYPLAQARPTSAGLGGASLSDGYDLYPAAAMYAADCLVRAREAGQDVCRVPAIETAREAAATLRQDPEARPETPTWSDVRQTWEKPQAVIWSSDAAPRQQVLWRQTSTGEMPRCEPRPSLWQRLSQRGPAQGDQQACTHTLSLGYDRVVAGLGLSRDRDYPDLLSDKLVLIGVHFRNSDWIATPLHGALPGVQYHAMSLDNLLEFGRGYRRNEGAGLGWGDALSFGLAFLMLFTVYLASMAKRRISRIRGPMGTIRTLVWYGGLTAVLLGIITTYLLALGPVLRAFTINWIGMLAVAAGAAWFTAKTDLRDDLAQWMNRSSPGRRVVAAAAGVERWLSYPRSDDGKEK